MYTSIYFTRIRSPFHSSVVQRRQMTFRIDTVKLHRDAFKTMPDVHKIHLQRLGLSIPLFRVIRSTWSGLILILY